MAPTTLDRKRKAVTRDVPESSDAESEAEFGGAILEGILSQSEDSEEDSGTEEDSENEEDVNLDGPEALDSDEIPSDMDEEDVVGWNGASNKTNGSKDVAKKIIGEHQPLDEDEDKPNYTVVKDANGGERYVYEEINPVYDSDDSDAVAPTNTIGNIPLSFYDSYPHIGYDINGKKIMRPAKGEALDALLDSIDIPKGWTGLTDPATGKPLNLSQDELEILRRIQTNEAPEDGYDPYPATVEYFTGIEEIMPLSSAPEPKRRFLPSKHEAKRVMKIVRAIREGRILPYRPPEDKEEEEEHHYDIWQDEQPRPDHVMNIPAPKMAPPGYDMSYNPPPEYLPTKAEKQAWESADPEDREKEYLPTAYGSLRKVPGYEKFINERFERSLDLYLAPRVRKNRLNIDPASLLPKLPRPEELKPFPTVCSTLFRGHEGRVRSLEIDPSGVWLASGGDDGTVRVWELLTGRQIWSAKISHDEAVNVVKWRPGKDAVILSAAAGEDIYLLVPPVVDPETDIVSRDLLDQGFGYATNSTQALTANGARKEPVAKWTRPGSRLEDEGVLLKITVRTTVKVISWHRRGDFFSTVSPTAQRSAVAIHTLSKHLTQIPFRRLPGIPQTVQFHPSRPLFFVATQRTIRSYDLQKQELVKIIQPGARWISSFDIHPGGDNLIVGSYDRRLLWHDLDLSTRPYKTLRFHHKAIRAVKYHKGGFPLFADASDDGSLQIFHGKVVSDLMENATIVPVKVLKGHKVKSALGVMDIDWHPREPWCVSAGADGTCRLWM
ncbi:putative ribosome biogenesis protein erb1 [Amylocarpus encephaloides]|uniref:Ribosome biogenesis protein ERB1 n=1 Tax=Amylocarpus encephaloides TaxID=45428 RepID=A0A9P7YKQ4_9HELO|nr:putative ribosome biogenesis protein erb1 [Amylocarpus encephaloides]